MLINESFSLFLPILVAAMAPIGDAKPNDEVIRDAKLLYDNWMIVFDKTDTATTQNPAGLLVKEGVTILTDFLDKEVDSETGTHTLRVLRHAIATHEDNDIFVAAISQASIVVFSKDAYRKELVGIVSTHFSSTIYGNSEIEYWLTWRSRKTLTDGFLVLFEAYDLANDSNRARIAKAVRRSLIDLVEQDADNDEYMRTARVWYEANKDKLKTDQNYSLNFLRRLPANLRSTLFVE